MEGQAGRESAKGRIKSMAERLRKQADGLDKLSDQIDNLTPEAEECLWRLVCLSNMCR